MSRHMWQFSEPRLIGRYPVPGLHLVGTAAPVPPTPPTRWPTFEMQPSYGIDYTFTHMVDRVPVRWPAGAAIVVRLAGAGPSDASAVLDEVVTELCGLTGFELGIGAAVPSVAELARPPVGEIHVGYVALDGARLPDGITRNASALGLGGATRASGGGSLCAGFALVDPVRCGGGAADSVGVLRHELGHALGLGHANRDTSVMHERAGTTSWTWADRVALRLSGSAEPATKPSSVRVVCAR